MTIPARTRLGPFEITGAIGAGGMGEVYRARDTRLQRDVALKVLPEIFAADPARMARFEREARLLASLNHPHIAAVYGVEESDSCRALVMELVEGPTLADRIAAGPIPLEDALPIAKQVAEAVEYAHDHGVIHRDLKPANIKVTADGTVKVLDFGLAKALTDEPTETDLRNSPTLSAVATMQGVILGTAAYMSPEQAKGKPVDRRADIWAFGVVLVEMLTGKSLYTGETPAETLASVMMKDPALGALPANTPPSIRNLIQRCLTKDPRQRLRDIGEARIVIGDVLSGAAPAEPVPPQGKSRERLFGRIAAAVAVVLLLALAAISFVHFRETQTEQRIVRIQIPAPGKAIPIAFKLSPDGRYLAFITNEGGPTRVWVQPLDSFQPQPLAGTEDASFMFWSPDSAFIGFFAQGKLKKIAAAGGLPQTISDAPTGRGGAWNRDGVIVFAPIVQGGLYQVSAAGGVPTPVTKLAAPASNADSHRYPEFLPDGRRFLYVCLCEKAEDAGVYVGSLDGSPPVRILPDSDVVYAPAVRGRGGYLLFRRENTLMAQPFDPGRLQTTGDLFPLAAPVDRGEAQGSAAVSVTDNGVLAYRSGNRAQMGNRELVWLDRTGKRLGVITKADAIQQAVLSPDDKKIAFEVVNSTSKSNDIWLEDLARGAKSRFSFGPGSVNIHPVWSPDASHIVYASNQGTLMGLYQKPSSGAGKEELLLQAGFNTHPYDWSRDGKFIVYTQTGEKTRDDLWLLPIEGDHKPIPYLNTQFVEMRGQFSPDGRWMAYDSDESGQQRVYVQTVPVSGAKLQISTAGGGQPRWRRDGKELFYLAADGKPMAVPVMLAPSFEAGTPQPLFEGIPLALDALGRSFTYQPSADGQRFLVNLPATGEAAAATPINVVLNWQAELRK